jgi:hypothetical protein
MCGPCRGSGERWGLQPLLFSCRLLRSAAAGSRTVAAMFILHPSLPGTIWGLEQAIIILHLPGTTRGSSPDDSDWDVARRAARRAGLGVGQRAHRTVGTLGRASDARRIRRGGGGLGVLDSDLDADLRRLRPVLQVDWRQPVTGAGRPRCCGGQARSPGPGLG